MDRLALQGAYTPAPCGRLTNYGTYTIVFCIRASNTVLLAGLRTNTFIGADPNPDRPVMLFTPFRRTIHIYYGHEGLPVCVKPDLPLWPDYLVLKPEFVVHRRCLKT